ncbi:MAG: tRNA uracil 4-sulfurtransferase ThiI [Candidatus Gracilibacteria bacterium]|jgi:thiamine biosynthesis protein ThiI
MKRYLLVHYGEIGLKGSNLQYFVEKLVKMIRDKLQKEFRENFSIKHVLGRLMIPLPEEFEEERYSKILSKICGVSSFLFVYEGNIDLAKLGEQIWKNMEEFSMDCKTFVVRVKRSQLLSCTSCEAEAELGAILLRNGIDKGVRMKGADLEINVEFFNEHGYFAYKKYHGTCGMPSNSGSKLVCMISGGIDSPVAAYRMMRRGARVIFVHFSGYPYTDQEEVEHVKEIVDILSGYQFHTKLYVVPFGEIQKKIATTLEIPGKLRVILYRRMMLRISEQISMKNEAKGVITGDSYGQVASQTSENIFAIHEASKIPIYQPLIAYDKEEIVRIAEEIGTFEISKLPCKDTCSMFSPIHPELKANVSEVLDAEKYLKIDEFMEEALRKTRVVKY